MNPRGELFGRRRLACAFEASGDVAIREAVRRLAHAVADHGADHPQTDDVTLLVLEARPRAPARSAKDHRNVPTRIIRERRQ
jgi:serine phosphatase RsbU (regulator of sigma subunit)